MPTTIQTSLFSSDLVLMFVKWAILLILAFYAIFALMVVRQVDLMSRTVISGASPVIKAFSILHAGFAIGLIVLVWGML